MLFDRSQSSAERDLCLNPTVMQTPMFRNVEKTMSDSSLSDIDNDKRTMALSVALRSSLPATEYNISHFLRSIFDAVSSPVPTTASLLLISSETSFLTSDIRYTAGQSLRAPQTCASLV